MMKSNLRMQGNRFGKTRVRQRKFVVAFPFCPAKTFHISTGKPLMRNAPVPVVAQEKSEFNKALSKEFLNRAENWRDFQDARPAWVGQLWKDWPMEPQLPKKEADAVHAAMVKYIRNLPRKQDIEAVIAFRPEAAPLMERWREAWDRSFPGWEEADRWASRKNEEHYVEWALNGMTKFVDKMIVDENKLGSLAKAYRTAEEWLAWAKDDLRDKRLHVIDDADITLSCVHLSPGMGLLAFGNIYFQYDGMDADGYPKFSEARASQTRVDARVNDNPKYWTWDFFLPYMNRRSLVADNLKDAGALIADMAWQGHKKAFIKAGGSKVGTWTIDLSGIKTLTDGEMALRGVLPTDATNVKQGYIIQEHLPFTHEQRFFVHDGRLIASVCSDRHFSVTDKRPNRRLDDRIATLDVPEVDRGAYDRGVTHHVSDRQLSARLARKAREIARVCRENGVLDFVVDIGLTSRGITAVEINTLHLSGPYCLDRRWFMQSFERRKKKIEANVEKRMLSYAQSIVDDHRFLAVMMKQFETIKTSPTGGVLQSMLQKFDSSNGRALDDEGSIENFAERLAIRALLSEDVVLDEAQV
jgi:hypothetical protein